MGWCVLVKIRFCGHEADRQVSCSFRVSAVSLHGVANSHPCFLGHRRPRRHKSRKMQDASCQSTIRRPVALIYAQQVRMTDGKNTYDEVGGRVRRVYFVCVEAWGRSECPPKSEFASIIHAIANVRRSQSEVRIQALRTGLVAKQRTLRQHRHIE